MYGNTGDTVACEASPFRPLDAFADSVPVVERVLSTADLRGMVIHPGMVYEPGGGVFRFMFEDARSRGRIRVIGGEDVRWPLVHQDDLGVLYVLMLEKGRPGDTYCAAAVEGFPVGRMARAIAKRFDVSAEVGVITVQEAMNKLGVWYEGFAIDQQMSGRKATLELGWCPVHRDPVADLLG